LNLRNTKDRKTAFSLVFFVLAVLLTGLTTAELIKIASGATSDQTISKEALAQLTPDDEKVQHYLNQYQATAEELMGNNSFVPPPSGPESPGDCTAIFGDEARIGDRWVSVGDRVGEAEVIEIGPTRVTLMLEDRRITRSPVLVVENTRNAGRNNRGSAQNRAPMGRNRGGRGTRGNQSGRGSSDSNPRVYSFDGSTSRSFNLSGDMWQDVNVEFMDDMEVRTLETDFGTVSIGTMGGSGDGPVQGTFNVIRATPEVIRR